MKFEKILNIPLNEAVNPLLDFSVTTHLIASSIFLLVAAILFSRNTENFIGKKFRFFCLAATLSQLLLFFAKGSWSPIEFALLASQVTLFSIAIVLNALAGDAEISRAMKIWSKTSVFISFCSLWISCIALSNFPAASYFSLEEYPLAFLGIYLLVLISSLLLSEQIFRNARVESKIVSKPFFIAIWMWFAAEIYLTSYMLSTGQLDSSMHFLMGYYAIAIAVVSLVGACRSSFEQKFQYSASKVFYSASLRISIVTLIIIALSIPLIADQNINLTDVTQLLFISAWMVVIGVLVLSSRYRSSLRVAVNKQFFGNKYNYRAIWLTLIERLTSSHDVDSFNQNSLDVLGDIFNAEGGALWVKNSEDVLQLVVEKNIDVDRERATPLQKNEIFFNPPMDQNWIYTLSGTNDSKAKERNYLLPPWLIEIPNVWIAAAINTPNELLGFFVLTKSNPDPSMIWEDLDIARSASSQIASYLSRLQSAEKLTESKQFETYNQLTAFIMHDLKNLIAQQALVVKNANKHKDNPVFVEDMIRTIANSVQRMNGLLARLKRDEETSGKSTIDLKKLLLEAIRKSTDRQPIPTLRQQDFSINLKTDVDQLTMVIVHLIRNAQDATKPQGFIDIDVEEIDSERVRITIEDNGSGMSQDFLENRLFKPFESTKSSLGMGIGAFQARKIVRNLGGDVKVTSEEKVGTTVSILLPIT